MSDIPICLGQINKQRMHKMRPTPTKPTLTFATKPIHLVTSNLYATHSYYNIRETAHRPSIVAFVYIPRSMAQRDKLRMRNHSSPSVDEQNVSVD